MSTISAEYQYRWENDIKKWYETEGKKFSKYDIQSAKNKKYGYWYFVIVNEWISFLLEWILADYDIAPRGVLFSMHKMFLD